MKKVYNQATKSDMPLDSSVISSTPTAPKTTKSKINVIGKKTGTSKSATSSKSATTKNSTASKSSSTSKTQTSSTKKSSVLKSNSIELQDLEKLNDDNLKKLTFRTKRNRVVIITLALLLVIAIASIIIYSTISKLENNCFLEVRGDASATYVIDGKELEKFRTPSNLQGNRILEFDTDIKIESSGSYYVHFQILCYQNEVLLNNTLVYNPNLELFELGLDGCYYSREMISGNQTVDLCQGVVLDMQYEHSLTVDNFTMKIITVFERV